MSQPRILFPLWRMNLFLGNSFPNYVTDLLHSLRKWKLYSYATIAGWKNCTWQDLLTFPFFFPQEQFLKKLSVKICQSDRPEFVHLQNDLLIKKQINRSPKWCWWETFNISIPERPFWKIESGRMLFCNRTELHPGGLHRRILPY